MKLSIIIPIYNAEKYINDCLDSITKTNKDIEIILIDDGSKDNSLNVCKCYSNKDKRVKVYHQDNKGASGARNEGIRKANGDYITFVDADDLLTEDWDNIIDYLDKDDIYYFASINPSNKNELIRYITGINDKGICIASSCSKAFRREFLLNNNLLFNENLINGEDMLFNTEAALLSKTYKAIDFHYYLYRQVIGQSTRKFNEKIISTDKEFHKQLELIFDKYKFDKDISKEIKTSSIEKGIILILRRISYIHGFKNAEKYYSFIEEEPYKNIINNNDSLIFKKCRKKQFKSLFYYFKFKNRISLFVQKVKKKNFIKI